MKLFVQSSHCASGLHCRTCRDRDGGLATRVAWAKRYDGVPVDAECPKGVAWGYAPNVTGFKPGETPSITPTSPSRGLGDVVSKVIKAVTLGKVKECGGCAKRRAALNKAVPFRRESTD